MQCLHLEIIEEGSLAALSVNFTLEDQIREAQKTDMEVIKIREEMKEGKAKCFKEDAHGALCFRNRLVVPFDRNLRELILKEAHDSKYSIHPGSTKMYQDLKKRLWWSK